jgi:KDO2-lipid IV(A) lauroyltransferase
MWFHLLKLVAFLFSRLPRPMLVALGKGLGRIAFALVPSQRKRALDNLALAFGNEKSEAERKRMARGSFENLGMALFEFMGLPWLKRDGLKGYVEVEGLANMDMALRRKKGVMCVTAHFGSWELMAASIGLLGYPVSVVARRQKIEAFEKYIVWTRTRSGNAVIEKKNAMRKLMRALSDNEIIGILMDHNVTRSEGVFVDFFGTPASTNKGPATLAMRTGSPVVPMFIMREGVRHRVVIGEEIPMRTTGDKEADVIENTARITREIERVVRSRPELWFWVHRRWRTRPTGEAQRK